MDIIYYGLLGAGFTMAYIGSTAITTGIKAILDGDIYGIAVVIWGTAWMGIAIYHGILAGRRRQSRE